MHRERAASEYSSPTWARDDGTPEADVPFIPFVLERDEADQASADKHMSKARRQHRITKLLETHGVTSQTQLVELLAEEGINATQATVSRDLDDLGAIKVRVPGGESVYAIPELPSEQIAPEDHLRRVLGEWVADVVVSSNLVVIRTPPGSAHVVASAIDRAGLSEIVGTVAGDDTIIAVAAEHIGGTKAAHLLRELAGL